MFALRQRLRSLAIWLPFRVVVAVAILATHFAIVIHLGRERFDYPFDRSPGAAPVFHHPESDSAPENWNRLVVSRWDAQHYMGIGMRGYSTCKPRAQLLAGEFPDDNRTCELNFYPTYGLLGAAVVALTHAPMDWALLGLSLAASLVFMVMWTGKEMVEGLGVGNAYLSLLLLNAFTTGFALVTVQTEPITMALTLGSFVCVRKGWLLPGALVAGAATAMRISGVATGFAFCAAMLVVTLRESPTRKTTWLLRMLLMPLSGWGILGLMTYYAWRFGDPLIYAHAHGRAFHHTLGLERVFFPDGRLLLQSIWAEPNDGLFLAAALLWFALGHRAGLGRFSVEAQAFWYVLFFGIVGISVVGSAELAYAGNTRYMLLVLPLFFAMAALLRRRPVALALWLLMSMVHYYHGSLCAYVGQNHPQLSQKCNFPKYYRTEDLARGLP
jgi:hypothetical protein